MYFFEQSKPVGVTMFGSVRRFDPRWLFAEDRAPSDIGSLVSPLRRYENLADFCRQESPEWVLVHRGYALGDIVMLLPILAAMHRALGLRNKVILATRDGFLSDLISINGTKYPVGIVRSRGTDHDYGASVHVDLDGVLEIDHDGGAASKRHRMDLYADFMGLEIRR